MQQLQIQQMMSNQAPGQVMNAQGLPAQFQGTQTQADRSRFGGQQQMKANPQQGFDILRLSNPPLENVNEDFICSICQKILN